jgi:Tfp pilus assembly protein PilF
MRRRCDALRVRAALALAAALIVAPPVAAKKRPADDANAAAVNQNDFVVEQPLRVKGGVREDFERAVKQLEDGRAADAIPLLERVTAAAPKAVAAHVNLALAYERAGDSSRAEASLARALAASPHHPVALNELGLLQRKTGRFADARKSYEHALARYPSFHFAWRNLAILCDLYLADAACARGSYERYAQLAPQDPEATRWLAEYRARKAKE